MDHVLYQQAQPLEVNRWDEQEKILNDLDSLMQYLCTLRELDPQRKVIESLPCNSCHAYSSCNFAFDVHHKRCPFRRIAPFEQITCTGHKEQCGHYAEVKFILERLNLTDRKRLARAFSIESSEIQLFDGLLISLKKVKNRKYCNPVQKSRRGFIHPLHYDRRFPPCTRCPQIARNSVQDVQHLRNLLIIEIIADNIGDDLGKHIKSFII